MTECDGVTAVYTIRQLLGLGAGKVVCFFHGDMVHLKNPIFQPTTIKVHGMAHRFSSNWRCDCTSAMPRVKQQLDRIVRSTMKGPKIEIHTICASADTGAQTAKAN